MSEFMTKEQKEILFKEAKGVAGDLLEYFATQRVEKTVGVTAMFLLLEHLEESDPHVGVYITEVKEAFAKHKVKHATKEVISGQA